MTDPRHESATEGRLVGPHDLATQVAASERGRADGTSAPLVLDLRPVEDFVLGHLPGARHLDLYGVSLCDTDPGPLAAFLWMVGELFASRGVDGRRPVVVYDHQSGMRAARALWLLECLGHQGVGLLDGGFDGWCRAKLPATTAVDRPVRQPWTPGRDESRLATWRDVASGLERDGIVIVDTRSEEEHRGVVMRAARGGAVPGAVHLDWRESLDANGAFKSVTELKGLYASVGILPGHDVITYCQTGYRSAHTYVGMRLAGYPRVRSYLGSWKEWGDRLDLPIERPPATAGPTSRR